MKFTPEALRSFDDKTLDALSGALERYGDSVSEEPDQYDYTPEDVRNLYDQIEAEKKRRPWLWV